MASHVDGWMARWMDTEGRCLDVGGWLARWMDGYRRYVGRHVDGWQARGMDTEGRCVDMCMDGWLSGWIEKVAG